MIATRDTAKPAVRVNHLEWARVVSWLSLVFPLAISALLNMWNLVQNGYSNTYYSVAVQSMLQSFHNFFFASYDAGGFITVDKPPVALWIQAISAKIFGFNSLALLMPEALAGVACVGIVYYLVRRTFGTLAAFVAAVAMAVTPIAIAVERGNNTDTWLMFFLLLAAVAITKATEKGRLVLLIASMALVGVAFNVKMLEAFIVLPTFYLLYMVAAPLKWWKRIAHLAIATVVLFTVAFSWATVVELTPADQRPWVGGSQTNSVFDLAFNYNGLGRITGSEGAGAPGGGTTTGDGGQGSFTPPTGMQGATGTISTTATISNTATLGTLAQTDGTGTTTNRQPPSGGFGGDGRTGTTSSSGMFNAGVAGVFRLFGSELASQWSWLFPLALFGVLATALGLKRKLPVDNKGQAILLWGGWLATYGVVFSMAEGIFHTYYLIIIAPAVAALVGMGIASLWKAYRNGGWQAWMLPIALVITAAWQVKVLQDYNYPQWSQWLIPITVAGSVLTAVPLLASRLFTKRIWRRLSPALVGVALMALVAAPVAWAVTPAMAAGNGTMPTAGPSTSSQGGGMGQAPGAQLAGTDGTQGAQGGQGGNTLSSSLITYLEANNDGYFYLVAVSSANQASSIVLETGLPVLATGGFSGTDPALTVEKLEALVASKQVKYVMGLDSANGRSSTSTSSVSSWVTANCTAVAASEYGSSTSSTTGGGGMNGSSQLYNCAAN